MKSNLRIIIIGPPASGKGTVASRLSNDSKFPHISTGDILRNTKDKDVIDLISQGKFVSDETIYKLISEHLQEKSFILDGFPRNIAQAKMINGRLDMVILLNVDDEVCVSRACNRNQGRCDDKKEIVLERLKTYHEDTEPIIKYFKDQKLLYEIDGNKNIDDVYDSVLSVVENKQKDIFYSWLLFSLVIL